MLLRVYRLLFAECGLLFVVFVVGCLLFVLFRLLFVVCLVVVCCVFNCSLRIAGWW